MEALGYLATGSSHRVSSDDVIVMNGVDEAVSRAVVHVGDRSVDISLVIKHSGSNKAFVGKTPSTIAETASWLSVVFFSPEDLAIIRSDPSHRRRFLDSSLLSHTPRFHGVLSDYDKVLRQRNMLLKSARHRPSDRDFDSTKAVWDDALVKLATEITIGRNQFLRALNPFFSAAYNDIRPGHDVTIQLLHAQEQLAHVTDNENPNELANAYRGVVDTMSQMEQDRGVTLVGPHRDDVLMSLNGLPTRTHSSQGEAWSTALALKLGLARLLRQESYSGDPVIILDDVFSELDQTRRDALAGAIGDWEQVLITAAVSADLPDHLTGQLFRVDGGRVEPV